MGRGKELSKALREKVAELKNQEKAIKGIQILESANLQQHHGQAI